MMSTPQMLFRLCLVMVLLLALVGAVVSAAKAWLAEQYFRADMARRPLRSTKRDAKRAALAYAESVVGHQLTWKAARKLLAQWERDGWSNPYAGGDATAAEDGEG